MTQRRRVPPRTTLAAVTCPAALAALFALLTAASWRCWPDVQVDFGRELYVAWALASGRTLYVDVFDKNGPLPHYVNALWFKLFGASLTVLAVCNLAILALFVALVYRTCLRLTDRLTATLCGATVLVVSGIAQEIETGNYNFVTPYNHHQTHGLVLGALGVAGLERWLAGGRAGFAGVAGLCLGLVFLTKAELFVPIAGASVVAWGAAVFGEDAAVRPRRALLPFLLGAILPILAFTASLATRMPLGVAWDGVLGNWRHLGAGTFRDPFYQAGMGLDHPLENLGAMLRATLVVSVAALAAIWGDRVSRGSPRGRRIPVVASTLLFALIVAFGPVIPWFDAALVLPVVCAAAVIGGAWWWHRASADAQGRRGALSIALWGTYAGLLLAKLGLLPRFYHYGFALASVATVLGVALLVGGVPRWLRSRNGAGGDLFRALATAAVLAFLMFLTLYSNAWWAGKTLRLGSGDDAVLVNPPPELTGAIMARGLARLRAVVPPGGTLAVLPEGAFLNYWLRSPNPTPYLSLLPEEIEAAGGEPAVTARFQLTAPDIIVLISRSGGEFGVGIFGRDPRWGKSLVDWVRRVYEPVETLGADPLAGQGFGITILRRAGEAANR
ncbi:MAG TPA: hypothetical protein VK714_16660 [Myxococcota bacterium]|nr:hypothetical protein [Myxococcota bacterium]